MSTPAGNISGVATAANSLFDGVLGSIETRLQLFSVELHEEKLRLIHLSSWVAATAFAAFMSATLLTVWAVAFFWESARQTALGAAAGLYVTALFIGWMQVRRVLQKGRSPFAATLAEFARDRECLRKQN